LDPLRYGHSTKISLEVGTPQTSTLE
jgi:hypothetical protein